MLLEIFLMFPNVCVLALVGILLSSISSTIKVGEVLTNYCLSFCNKFAYQGVHVSYSFRTNNCFGVPSERVIAKLKVY